MKFLTRISSNGVTFRMQQFAIRWIGNSWYDGVLFLFDEAAVGMSAIRVRSSRR